MLDITRKKTSLFKCSIYIDLIKSKSKSFAAHMLGALTSFSIDSLKSKRRKVEREMMEKLSEMYDQYPQNWRYKNTDNKSYNVFFNDCRLEIQDLDKLLFF